MPKEIRSNPTWRSSSRSQRATLSGLASVVTSTSGASPNSAPIAASTEPSSPGASSVGVPPPKKTVDTGTSTSPRTRRAKRISSMAASAYVARDAPRASAVRPRSSAV